MTVYVSMAVVKTYMVPAFSFRKTSRFRATNVLFGFMASRFVATRVVKKVSGGVTMVRVLLIRCIRSVLTMVTLTRIVLATTLTRPAVRVPMKLVVIMMRILVVSMI